MKESWSSSEGGSPLRFTHKGLGGRLLKASAFSLANTQPNFSFIRAFSSVAIRRTIRKLLSLFHELAQQQHESMFKSQGF